MCRSMPWAMNRRGVWPFGWRGEAAHLLVCSDLTRTQQTAWPIRQQSLQPFARNTLLNNALREQNFGVVDGLRVDDIKAQHPEAWAQWIQFQLDYAFAGGKARARAPFPMLV